MTLRVGTLFVHLVLFVLGPVKQPNVSARPRSDPNLMLAQIDTRALRHLPMFQKSLNVITHLRVKALRALKVSVAEAGHWHKQGEAYESKHRT